MHIRRAHVSDHLTDGSSGGHLSRFTSPSDADPRSRRSANERDGLTSARVAGDRQNRPPPPTPGCRRHVRDSRRALAADALEVVRVVVVGDPEQAGDVQPAIRRMGPGPGPAGVVEGTDGRDGDGSGGRECGQDLLERRVVEAGRKAGFGPCPVRVVLGGDAGQTRSPDRLLDRDEMADRLVRAPLAGGDRPPFRRRACATAPSRAGKPANVSTSSVRFMRRAPRRRGSAPASAPPRRAARPSGRRSRPAGRDRSGRPRSSGCRGSTGSSRRPTAPGHIANDSVSRMPARDSASSRSNSVPFSVWSGQAG